MKKMLRKLLSIALTVSLVLACTTLPAFAQSSQVGVTYQTHVQNLGWMSYVSNGEMAGTTGRSLRLEALVLKLTNAPAGAKINYQAHVRTAGWLPTVSDGAVAGTSGQSLRAEAFRISLENMPGYSVEYRAYVQDSGWQEWVRDGATAGTTGQSRQMEAIEIRIIKVDETITVTPASMTLIAGGMTGTVEAKVNSLNAADTAASKITWSTSDAKIATVSNGIVTPLTPGTVTITATLGDTGKTAASAVTVLPVNYILPVIVTFVGNGGSYTVPIAAAEKNTTIKMPVNPTKAGYTFAGWYTDNNSFLNEFTGYTHVADSISVYAKWTPVVYTISFDSNGGSEVTAIRQNYAEAVTSPSSPVKSGFAFGGWSPLFPAVMPLNGAELLAAWNPKSLTVDGQTTSLTARTTGQSAVFEVDTVNVADNEAVTISWFASNGTTPVSAPTGITATALDAFENKSTVSINADGTSSAGQYYFRAVIDGVKSNLVTVTVDKATPTIDTYATPGHIVYGDTLAVSVLTGGLAVHNGTEVAGTFELLNLSTMPAAGNYSAGVKFTPADQSNYNTISSAVSGSGVRTVTVIVDLRPITITANSLSKVYDGTNLNSSGFGITSGSLVTTQTLSSATTTGSQLFVGNSASTTNNAVITDNSDNDVTSNYAVTYIQGTLTVTRASIALIVTADSNQKVYDGTPITDTGWSFTGTLASGDSLTATVFGSKTDVGTTMNTVTGVTIMHSGTDVTENYSIGYVSGTLEVTARPVTFTAENDTKMYDGTALTKASVFVSGGSLADNQELGSVTVTGSQTVVGSTVNTASSAIIRDANSNNVTSNYTISYVTGLIKVITRPITISPDNVSKVYDGTALTSSAVSVTTGSLANGQRIGTITVLGSQTNAGSGNNTASAAIIRDSSNADVTSNYTITYSTGTLTIAARPITITGATNSKVYDGTPLSNHNSELDNGSTLAAGEILFTVSTAGSRTNVGYSNNTPSAAVILRGEANVTSNYAITYTPGTLTITARPITITAKSSTLTYNGIAQSVSGWDLTAGTLAGTQTFSATVGASGTDAAAYTTSFSNVKVSSGAADVTSNYNITLLNGSLTINPLGISIYAFNDSKVYDATVLVNHTSELNPATPLAPDDILFLVTTTGSRTNAGSSSNTPSDAVILRGEADVTHNYSITYVNGTLTIVPRPITVTSAADSKTYDGTASSSGQPTITGGNLVSGQTGSWTQSFAQSTAGTNINLIPVGSVWNGGVNATGNYNITYTYTPGTINQRPITLTAVSDTKTFDGNTSSVGQPTLTGGSLVSDQSGSWTQSFAQSAVGTNISILPTGTIWNGGQNVTGSYSISTISAAGTINAVPGNIISIDGNTITIGSVDGPIIASAGFVVTSFNQNHSSQSDVYYLKGYDETTSAWVTLAQNPASYSLGGGQLTVPYAYSAEHPYSLIEFYFFNTDGCLAGYQSTIEYSVTYLPD